MHMLKTLLFLLPATRATCAGYVREVPPSTDLSISHTQLPTAPFVASLTNKVRRPAAKTRALRELRGLPHSTRTTAGVSGTDNDEEYLAEKGFQCFTLDAAPVSEADCLFGSPGFDPSTSTTFVPLSDKNFNISYESGEFVTGTVGFDTISVGGLRVAHQEFGLVNKAAWTGDGVNTGILGLAYPELTSVYNGTNPGADGANNRDPYSSFFFSAVKEKVVMEPYYSVALNRGSFANQVNSTYDPHLGYIAFGGIAPVSTVGPSVTVPVQRIPSSSGGSEFLFYAVDVDAWVFPGLNSRHTAGAVILDTGTTLNYLPTEVAAAFNSRFEPPATFDAEEDAWFVDCNATAPLFSVVIGGVGFVIDPKDQISPYMDVGGNISCASGTQDGGSPGNGSIFVL
ncbi:hypothetical protein EIP86_006934 [Pleurotus ostreatoroseus]|nr:hypothetical protein EIP86_006934 [Pleurotus ostreatoroseus]